jgi:RNA polymerase sigma-70 factor (ECF subfamily)
LENGVPFPPSTEEKNMQVPETYIGSEQHLAVRFLEASGRELNDVLARSLPSFQRKAYRYLGNSADAEDAVQDALLSAYKHIDQFRGDAQMSTWLTAIVSNAARMKLRRRPRQIHVSMDEQFGEDQEYSMSDILAATGPSPEDNCRWSELRAQILRFMQQLSPRLRRTFQLRELDGLSTSETAHILGVPDGTVKAQLTRARAKLRRLMRRGLAPQPHALGPARREACPRNRAQPAGNSM